MNASIPVIADPKVTRHILNAFHLRASKRLGQNFLVDRGVVQGIVDAAELSPADILKLNIMETLGLRAGERCKVVANLPYYITTPIIMTLLEQRLPIERLVTMVQKEVAVRMTARPGSKDYGALSIAVQYFTVPRMVMDVPPRSFLPAPEVTSAVIACQVQDVPTVQPADEKLFFRLVRATFGQRRKTLLNALTAAGLSKEMSRAGLLAAGIADNMRGEQLSLADFARLSDAVGSLEREEE